MPTTVFATPSDLEARWRPLSDDEENRAAVLLEDASLRVLRRFPTLEARIAAGTLQVQEVTAVVCGMVRRAMIAGGLDGVTQRTDGAGPYQQSVTYANPQGNLYLTADDLAILSAGGTGRVRSVRLTTAGDP